jgi:hypothetical protein
MNAWSTGNRNADVGCWPITSIPGLIARAAIEGNPFAVKKVRAQLFFDVADMPRDDGLIGIQPQRRPAEIRFFRCHYKMAKTAKVHSYRPRARRGIRGSRSGLRSERRREAKGVLHKSIPQAVARRDKNTKLLDPLPTTTSGLGSLAKRDRMTVGSPPAVGSIVTFEVRRRREASRSHATRWSSGIRTNGLRNWWHLLPAGNQALHSGRLANSSPAICTACCTTG